MQRLPMYPPSPLALIERDAPVPVNDKCHACALHERARTVCLGAEGEPGGVLLVGEYPTVYDDRAGRPFVGDAGKFLRTMVKKWWRGPVALDYALRCAPGRVETNEKHVDACRGYLAQTVREAKPERIIALGGKAILGLLGRAPPVLSVRRGYAWLYNDDISDTGAAIPVFMLNSPVAAVRNRFIRQRFEHDLKWALTTDPDPPPWEGEALLVRSADDAREACAALAGARWFAYDTETAGVMYEDDFRVVSLAATPAGGDDAFVWDARALATPEVVEPLKRLLADPNVGKVGQNLKFDAHAIRCGLGVVLAGYHGDTRLWRKLLAADVDARLEVMQELVGMGGGKEEAKAALQQAVKDIQKARREFASAQAREKAPAGGTLKERKTRTPPLPNVLDPILAAAVAKPHEHPLRYAYGLLPYDILSRYNAQDSVSTARLGVLLGGQLASVPFLQRTWDCVVAGASEAIEQIEAWGIGADRDAVENFSRYLESRQGEISERFGAYEGFNPNSTQSVSKLLFDTLGLSPTKTTGTGNPSTDKESLKALAGAHPIVADLIDWRRISKLRSQYAEGMRSHIREDGRIHPDIKIDGTRTGRLSCAEPNLQNIASPSDPEAKMARDIFIAPPGYTLLEADYSQLELRVATMLCQDPVMLAIWREGVDYHMKTAQMIADRVWGITPDQVTSEHRRRAKTVNFGIMYGMMARTLAKQLGCSVAEAEAILDAVRGRFKRFAAWCKEQHELARKTGFVYTWWDGERARRRPLWGIADNDDKQRSNAENAAINTPVQGTASDFCLASLVECVAWLREDCVPAKLVLTVHDSIMFEVRDDAVDEVAFQVHRIMSAWPSAGVPLVVDMKTGPAWGSLKEYVLPDPAPVAASA